MPFEMTVPLHCPLCCRVCEQPNPGVTVWHCHGCELTIRMSSRRVLRPVLPSRWRRRTAAAMAKVAGVSDD